MGTSISEEKDTTRSNQIIGWSKYLDQLDGLKMHVLIYLPVNAGHHVCIS